MNGHVEKVLEATIARGIEQVHAIVEFVMEFFFSKYKSKGEWYTIGRCEGNFNNKNTWGKPYFNSWGKSYYCNQGKHYKSGYNFKP